MNAFPLLSTPILSVNNAPHPPHPTESDSVYVKKDLRNQPTVEIASLAFSDPQGGAPLTC